MIATSATLVSVFTPISFLPSTAGRLFGEFGLVLAVAVCLSSFVALTLVPMLASRLLSAPHSLHKTTESLLSGKRSSIRRVYTSVLERILDAPVIVVGACVIVIIGAAITYERLGEEMVPKEDRGMIIISLLGPDGISLDQMDRQVEKAENILQPLFDSGTIKMLYSLTGRYDINRGYIQAPLKDWAERKIGEEEITRTLNSKFAQIAGARVCVWRGNSLGLRSAGGRLRFALTGSNYERIAGVADRFVQVLEMRAPQLTNIHVAFRATQPHISVSIDRRRASDLGVSIETLATTIKSLVDTDKVAELIVNDDRVPIVLQATKGTIDDPTDLRNLFVPSAKGELVPLSQVVTFREYAVAAELDRHGQRRAVEIFAGLADETSLREAVDVIQKLAGRELPPGISLLLLDEAAALNETKYGVSLTYIIALIIVFLVLVAQFESITSALVVLLTVPFGMCAAVFALALTGTTINIYSQIGVLMLIGIMAKNAILMMEFADQLRDRGKPVLAAAREASLVRFRPIIMTMVSAGLPLILGGGPGMEARAAIGWVVFGGLGMAACFTLFLTPILYVSIAGLVKQPCSQESGRVDEELKEAQAVLEKTGKVTADRRVG